MNLDVLKARIMEMYMMLRETPFPYNNVRAIQVDFSEQFIALENALISADFNNYCMLIVGTASYIVNERSEHIPVRQLELLEKDFFECFPEYIFLESRLASYLEFHKKYYEHETLRKLIKEYIQLT